LDTLIGPLLQYGVLGMVVIAFLVGLAAPKWVLDEYRAREKLNTDLLRDMAVSLKQLAELRRKP
jgi:pilus assembly protein TadC